MNISLANKKDSEEIAEIHKQEIDQGFLSQLGVKFLAKLYETMATSRNSFVVVAKENERVIGFIGGCLDVKDFYKNFLKKNFFSALFILLPKIFTIGTIKKIFETLKYSEKEEVNLPKAELLTIACRKEFYGKKIAIKMFGHFITTMGKKGIKEFKVVVGENLKRAIGFYKKVGFQFHSNTNIHGQESSRNYIYKIK